MFVYLIKSPKVASTEELNQNAPRADFVRVGGDTSRNKTRCSIAICTLLLLLVDGDGTCWSDQLDTTSMVFRKNIKSDLFNLERTIFLKQKPNINNIDDDFHPHLR